MKLKYVFILWTATIIISILLYLVLSSLGQPFMTLFLVIMAVLIVALVLTIPLMILEERSRQLEPSFESEAIRNLKQKEKIIVILLLCFIVIGPLLSIVTSYYMVEEIVSDGAVTEDSSVLGILGGIGRLFLLLAFVFVILWAYLRDKMKKMKLAIKREGIDRVLENKYRTWS